MAQRKLSRRSRVRLARIRRLLIADEKRTYEKLQRAYKVLKNVSKRLPIIGWFLD
jgi:hypothetical protein